MKEIKELKLEELTTKQKLGMVWTAHVRNFNFLPCPGDNMEFVLQMIRERSLGSVWVDPGLPNRAELMQQIKDAADYPIVKAVVERRFSANTGFIYVRGPVCRPGWLVEIEGIAVNKQGKAQFKNFI